VIIREEEITCEGPRVARAYQLDRWIDGTTFLCSADARRRPWRRPSGLRFDTTEP
jgi:hypothetical protein